MGDLFQLAKTKCIFDVSILFCVQCIMFLESVQQKFLKELEVAHKSQVLQKKNIKFDAYPCIPSKAIMCQLQSAIPD